jgi:hypothetical protein
MNAHVERFNRTIQEDLSIIMSNCLSSPMSSIAN